MDGVKFAPRRFIGRRINPETGGIVEVPEEEHFYQCQDCGQTVDMRMLDQVLHHAERDHEPMRRDA
jgi:hypothetical protein